MKYLHYIVAGLIGVFAANVQASTITYSLVNNAAYQNGLTLSGSITTDGTIGALDTENITAWSWELTDGSGDLVWSYAGAADCTAINVTATADEILLPTYGNNFILQLGGDNTALRWIGTPAENYGPVMDVPATRGYLAYDNATQQHWIDNFNDPALTSTQSGQWIVAQAVPEPSAAALLGLGALALIKRRKR